MLTTQKLTKNYVIPSQRNVTYLFGTSFTDFLRKTEFVPTQYVENLIGWQWLNSSNRITVQVSQCHLTSPHRQWNASPSAEKICTQALPNGFAAWSPTMADVFANLNMKVPSFQPREFEELCKLFSLQEYFRESACAYYRQLFVL